MQTIQGVLDFQSAPCTLHKLRSTESVLRQFQVSALSLFHGWSLVEREVISDG
jgi:hypothetical protein